MPTKLQRALTWLTSAGRTSAAQARADLDVPSTGALALKLDASEKGAPGGVAELDSHGYVVGVPRSSITLHTVPTPGFISHRGNCNVFPEHTMYAYRAASALGAQWVEIDSQRLGDGSWASIHDSTVDAATDGTGALSTFSAISFQRLKVDTTVASAAGLTEPPAMVADILREFGNRALLWYEVKAYADYDEQIAMLERAGIAKDMVVVQSFNADALVPFRAAGFPTCRSFATYAGSPTPASIKASGDTWVIVDQSTATAQMDALRAEGLRVAVYTVNTWRAMSGLAGHYDFLFTDDQFYLSGTARRTTDPFKDQCFYHGHRPVNGTGDNGGRGSFVAPNWWAVSHAAAWVGALQGWASPIGGVNTVGGADTLDEVTIEFAVKFVSGTTEDRFAWIGLMQSDTSVSADSGSGTTDCYGYYAVMRKNGGLAIYKVVGTGSTAPASLGTQTGTAISDGETATFRLTVSPTKVKIERLDEGAETELEVTDSTYRGAFLFAGVKGASVQFSDFTIATP